MIILAIISITLALVFYTIGVWSEHRSKHLKKIHLIFFWLGLCMDTTGTILMGRIAEQPMLSGKLSLHGVTGMLAIILSPLCRLKIFSVQRSEGSPVNRPL